MGSLGVRRPNRSNVLSDHSESPKRVRHASGAWWSSLQRCLGEGGVEDLLSADAGRRGTFCAHCCRAPIATSRVTHTHTHHRCIPLRRGDCGCWVPARDGVDVSMALVMRVSCVLSPVSRVVVLLTFDASVSDEIENECKRARHHVTRLAFRSWGWMIQSRVDLEPTTYLNTQ